MNDSFDQTMFYIQTQDKNWTVSSNFEKSSGVSSLHIKGKAAFESTIPEVVLTFTAPTVGMLFRWTPEADRLPALSDSPFECGGVVYLPVVSFYGMNDKNVLTLSLSDPQCESRFLCSPDGFHNRIKFRLELFRSGSGKAGTEFSIAVRFDTRTMPWREAVAEVVHGLEKEYPPMRVPEIGYQPFYSTWYAYFQNVSAEKLEAECRFAAKLGMKTIILDDGWQTSGNGDWFHDCGSWELYREKFPNMREHIRKIHELGMKYMVWFAIPFVGVDNPLFEKFRGKFLKRWGGGNVSILDPRYPDVREHLVSMLEHAMLEWDVDGFKLDYLESFRKLQSDFTMIGGKNGTADVVSEEEADGRDSDSVDEGLEKLMHAICTRLSAIKPDLMLEFRQTYIGPGMRRFGNLLRAGDCPCNILANRNRIVQIRLTSGKTAVHSDMITWNSADTVENAAMQLLNVLFAVPQISVKLAELPESHRKMLAFYLDFISRHSETLFKSGFFAGAPEHCYPSLTAESETEKITAVYEPRVVADIPAGKTAYLINASGTDRIYAKLSETCSCRTYSPEGILLNTQTIKSGLIEINTPNAGMICLEIEQRMFYK